MVLIRYLIAVSFYLCSTIVSAEDELRIVALFKNAAMVDFGGKQKLYRVGQNLAPQIKLVKADSTSAVFLIKGKEVEMGMEARTSFSAAGGAEAAVAQGPKTVKILRDQTGHYFTGGFINGIAVRFLVDTGATTIAMNERIAKLVGIPYEMEGIRGASSTANGLVEVWGVNLRKVRVGSIELKNIQGTVVKGAGPDEVLLGMSFLDKLKMETGGNLLKLTTKF